MAAPFWTTTAVAALWHALEALRNRHANPISDTLAVSAACRVIHALPRAQPEPADPLARETLSLAARETALAFARSRSALTHAPSYADRQS